MDDETIIIIGAAAVALLVLAKPISSTVNTALAPIQGAETFLSQIYGDIKAWGDPEHLLW